MNDSTRGELSAFSCCVYSRRRDSHGGRGLIGAEEGFDLGSPSARDAPPFRVRRCVCAVGHGRTATHAIRYRTVLLRVQLYLAYGTYMIHGSWRGPDRCRHVDTAYRSDTAFLQVTADSIIAYLRYGTRPGYTAVS